MTRHVGSAEYLELLDFHLIDGTGEPARKIERLLAVDGRIVAIQAASAPPPDLEPEPRSRWQRIDLDGAWVMPGLIDTHVHVARFPDARVMGERILRAAARGGVTSVRDLVGDARALADLERAIGRREFIGPTLVYSAMFGGPAIFRTGPTATMAHGRAPGGAPWARSVSAQSDLRQLIAEARGTGATNLKVYGDLAPALATAVIAEARRQQMQVTAHGTVFSARPSDLVEAGAGSLSHAPYLVWEAADRVPGDFGMRTQGPWQDTPPDHPALLHLYRRMAERGVSLDATLFVFRAMGDYAPQVQAEWTRQALPWAIEATRHAHEAGVRLTTGTDWFEPRQEGGLPNTHFELQILVDDVGLSPMQAILAATRNGAAALGLEDSTGTVEIGKRADLLVLEANPLDDIRNTMRIRMTIAGGSVVPFE